MAVRKNIPLKKGEGKQYHLPYDIKAVCKNIKWGRAEGDRNFVEKNQDLKKNGVGKNIKLKGTLYIPVPREDSEWPRSTDT